MWGRIRREKGEFDRIDRTAITRPGLVVHADWSVDPGKRWMACAALQADGRYSACAPEPVGPPSILFQRLIGRLKAQSLAGDHSTILVGFDFPIGLPAAYLHATGCDFLDLLPQLGMGQWKDFYRPAQAPDQVNILRPFYPHRSGSASHSHLLEGLGIASIDDLRRRCERPRPGRRAACPLFWTLGGQQVGKAAISGWQQVLAPALEDSALDAAFWPFSGQFSALLQDHRLVVAETYPAEFYTHLGISFPRRGAGGRSGKRVQGDRRSNAAAMLGWAAAAQALLDPALVAAIEDGFGPKPAGEDAFDAVVGLFGMLNVVLGFRQPGDSPDPLINRMEGWILGQEI